MDTMGAFTSLHRNHAESRLREWAVRVGKHGAPVISSSGSSGVIRRAIYARELPAVRLGKSYSIAIADLTKWFERKKKFM